MYFFQCWKPMIKPNVIVCTYLRMPMSRSYAPQWLCNNVTQHYAQCNRNALDSHAACVPLFITYCWVTFSCAPIVGHDWMMCKFSWHTYVWYLVGVVFSRVAAYMYVTIGFQQWRRQQGVCFIIITINNCLICTPHKVYMQWLKGGFQGKNHFLFS